MNPLFPSCNVYVSFLGFLSWGILVTDMDKTSFLEAVFSCSVAVFHPWSKLKKRGNDKFASFKKLELDI